MRRRVLLLVGGALLLAGLTWLRSYVAVGRPVAKALAADSRNAGFTLDGRYEYYVRAETLVLDLKGIDDGRTAPIDLFRGLFQSSAALAKGNRQFDRVILSRAGEPVFVMKGADFLELGTEFNGGQNPVYLIRTLPEKLFKPTGEAAFGTWTGGWLGILGKQMDDANQAADQWGRGSQGNDSSG